MVSFLKNHPFPVEAYFDTSLVLSFAVPKDVLQPLIPDCTVLDTFDDKWGFVAVAMVQTKKLRPKGFPSILGNDFFLIGYRIFVRYTNTRGKRLRGLYILKSETDKKKMAFLGNIFTKYSYTTTDITNTVQHNGFYIRSAKSRFEVEIEISDAEAALPENSPFQSWKEARRFAGPLPFTFTYNEKTKEVLIIEGVRGNWNPTPVTVTKCNIDFLKSMDISEKQLANAFIVANIPYYWKKGKIERWNG